MVLFLLSLTIKLLEAAQSLDCLQLHSDTVLQRLVTQRAGYKIRVPLTPTLVGRMPYLHGIALVLIPFPALVEMCWIMDHPPPSPGDFKPPAGWSLYQGFSPAALKNLKSSGLLCEGPWQ